MGRNGIIRTLNSVTNYQRDVMLFPVCHVSYSRESVMFFCFMGITSYSCNLQLWCRWVMQHSFASLFLLLFGKKTFALFLFEEPFALFLLVLLPSMRPFWSYILFLPMNPVKLNCGSSLFSSFLRQANKIANKLSFSVVKIWSYWIWHIWTDRSDRLLL